MQKEVVCESLESLFNPRSSVPPFDDTQISEDHFDTQQEEKSPLYHEVQQSLLNDHKMEVPSISSSSFSDLEGIIQEMENHLPPQSFIDVKGLGHFRVLKMLPLVAYSRSEGGRELYVGIQGEQRLLPSAEETSHVSAEQVLSRRRLVYSSSRPREIAATIAQEMSESPLSQKLREGGYSSQYLLLTISEFDKLEQCLLDPKARKDALGEIDEADTGEKTMWKVFERAIELKATDAHIEALDERKGVVRYRVDGYLISEPLPRIRIKNIVSAIKVKAKMKVEDKRLAQEGGIHFTEAYFDPEMLQEHQSLRGYNLRVETAPTVNEESASIRFLSQDEKIPRLEELGYETLLANFVREASSNAQGLMIITGPTGSGKTTTLYSILQEINKPEIRILTVENPVEYRMKGLIQTEINEAAGYDFAHAVRAFLRLDPDVVLVGEMRDIQTRESAMQLAQTGHMVFATLHTNDAPSTIKRLYDLGATNSDLESSLTGIIAQRLIRKLCPDCKEQYNGVETLNRLLGESVLKGELPLYQATGKIKGVNCAPCRGTGYNGRIAVPSFWRIGDHSRELFEEQYSYKKLTQSALEEGMIPLAVSGMKLVLEGVASLQELNGDVVPKGDIKKYRNDIVNLVKEY